MKNPISSYGLSKISSDDREDVVVCLRGLGANNPLHEKVRVFLQDCNLEVHHFDRGGDVLLGQDVSAIGKYQQDIRKYIEQLLVHGKKVHLFGSSFGGYLGLKVVEVMPESIRSIVAIAPVMNPITLYDRLTKRVEGSNIKLYLPDNKVISILSGGLPHAPVNIGEDNGVQGCIFCGGSDTISPASDLSVIKAPNIITHTLTEAGHLDILERPDTQRKIYDFYKEICK